VSRAWCLESAETAIPFFRVAGLDDTGAKRPLMRDDGEELNGGPWTALDEEDLRESLSSGASLDEVASFLCRDPLDVAERALALGLKWQHGKLH
jgi:hypothetical protein